MKRCRLGMLLGVMLVSEVGNADGLSTATVTPFDLAGKSIPIPDGASVRVISHGECKLSPSPDKKTWTFDARCDELTRLATLDSEVTVDARLTVRLKSPREYNASYRFIDDGVVFTIQNVAALESIAVPGPTGWAVVPLQDNATADALVKAHLQGTPNVWGRAKGEVFRLALTEAGPASGLRSDERRTWCKQPPGMDRNHYLICVAATDNRFRYISFEPRNHVLLPNRSIVVVVRHDSRHGVVITMTGERGLFDPTVANFAGPTTPEQQSKRPTDVTETIASFAPRRPGNADIHIELRDAGTNGAIVAEHTIELIVETTYVGAIRLGFGAIFGNGVDREYAAQLAPGSRQEEIAATRTGKVDVELVAGVSAYIGDIICCGGRSYSRRGASALIPALYLGVGIVAPTSDGVRAIPSLHLGGEWEISKSFAVSVTAVARRVTRLADGYAVGAPVGMTTAFTEQRYEWGWALVVSVSPEFLQLAVGGP